MLILLQQLKIVKKKTITLLNIYKVLYKKAQIMYY